MRLLNADKMGLKVTDIMFRVGPTRVTVSDCWTLIPPDVAKNHCKVTNAIPGFEPGWLVDKVPACLYSHVIYYLIL